MAKSDSRGSRKRLSATRHPRFPRALWRKMTEGNAIVRGLCVVLSGLALSGTLLYLSGPSAEVPPDLGEHPHRLGEHGGLTVALGDDDHHYHAEIVSEKGGVLLLYTLEEDLTRVLEVEAQTLRADVRAQAGGDVISVILRAVPQAGDTPGKASRFAGKLPPELRGIPLAIRIPQFLIAGRSYPLEFTTDDRHEDGMPAPAKEQQALYLKPGGKYTQADIEANGAIPAAQKFKGIRAEHDMKPKPGDKVCPITDTKANPNFAWIIGGKKYEFCCPPCIDEFVRQAKERPQEIKEPSHYVKK